MLPATTTLPNADRMRTRTTQLVVLIRIWNTPVDDSRQMPRITARSSAQVPRFDSHPPSGRVSVQNWYEHARAAADSWWPRRRR